ncbi:hypothetical protein KPA97_07575, partial [Burkholderia cenocepacia]|nr:hypothetical protein [Burkholderia cenocepacia]
MKCSHARCVDDDRDRSWCDAERRAEHVAQCGARRGAAYRILVPQEARGACALVAAQRRIRGRRERHAPVEIDARDPHAGARRGGRHVECVHAPCAGRFNGRSGIGRNAPVRGHTRHAAPRHSSTRSRMQRMHGARRVGGQHAVLQPVQRDGPQRIGEAAVEKREMADRVDTDVGRRDPQMRDVAARVIADQPLDRVDRAERVVVEADR